MPLLVVGAAVYLAPLRRDPPWPELARAFGAGFVWAFPAYVVVAAALTGFPPSYRGFSLYLRAAVGEHLLPMVLAMAGALATTWWRSRRATAASPVPEGVPQRERLIASVGGFLAAFAILERLSVLDDASSYRVLLLPLLRMATVALVAGLAGLALSWNGWTRAAIVVAAFAVPLLAALVPLLDALQLYAIGMALTFLLLSGAGLSLRWLAATTARFG